MEEIKERPKGVTPISVLNPVGTVLWKMVGTIKGAQGEQKVHWMPEAHAIQYADDGKFMFSHGGASWNSIGKSYFLTREECLADWGNKPTIEDLAEKERPELPDLNKIVVWRFDEVSILTIMVDNALVDLSELNWHHDIESESNYDPSCGDFLTLEEISGQILDKAPSGENQIIEVRIENPLKGVIYQYGNCQDNKWHKHGETRGYA